LIAFVLSLGALAIISGAGVATYGPLFVAAIVTLAVIIVAVGIYANDPVKALIALWLIEIFTTPLSATFGYFSSGGQAIRQADEVFVVLFLALTCVWATRQKARPPLRLILPALVVLLFGALGAVIQGVPIGVALLGGWLALKLWVMVGLTLLLPWKTTDFQRVYLVLTRVGVLVAIIGLIDYATRSAVSRALHISIAEDAGSFRSEAVHSILPHPGQFSLFMSLLFALAFTRFSSERRRVDLGLVVLFAIGVMLSLRLKGFLSLAAVILIVALAQAAVSNRGAVTVLLAACLLFVGAYSVGGNVVAHQISNYASSETSARARLYSVGVKIASNDLPLGVGFGRYASYPSRLYYSPVYNKYELSSTYGLSRAFPNYIDDTSWPSLLGETGYAGTLAYLAGLIALVLMIVRALKRSPRDLRWMPLSVLCVMTVILVDSLGAPTLFDWIATTAFALVLGPALVGVAVPARPAARTAT
jgi:hypothetical protein